MDQVNRWEKFQTVICTPAILAAVAVTFAGVLLDERALYRPALYVAAGAVIAYVASLAVELTIAARRGELRMSIPDEGEERE